MPDYALFLKCKFNPGDGNFDENTPTRKPNSRFWDEVQQTVGGTLTAQGRPVNADLNKMQLLANAAGADSVYFAVQVIAPPTARVTKISFTCGLHPNMRRNKATTASPFRDNGQIQCLLSTAPNKVIQVPRPGGGTDTYQAIGAYPLVRQTGAAAGDCCYYKLTVVATVEDNRLFREFAYDPDMDVEL